MAKPLDPVLQNYYGMRDWGGDVSLDLGWIMHSSVPAPSCSSQKFTTATEGETWEYSGISYGAVAAFPLFCIPGSFPFHQFWDTELPARRTTPYSQPKCPQNLLPSALLAFPSWKFKFIHCC